MSFMSYKCSKCNKSYVDNQGDLCDNCLTLTRQQTTLNSSNSQSNSSNRRKVLINPNINVSQIGPTNNTPVPTSQNNPSIAQVAPKQSPSNPTNPTPYTSVPVPKYIQGTVKNLRSEHLRESFFRRWGRTLFLGVPYFKYNEIQTFQLFSTNNASTANPNLHSCYEIIIYGQIKRGFITDNNTVQVWGSKRSNNSVYARKIINVTSNTTTQTTDGIPTIVAWILTILVPALVILIAGTYITIVIGIAVVGFILRAIWWYYKLPFLDSWRRL